jgi:hypothetical protein
MVKDTKTIMGMAKGTKNMGMAQNPRLGKGNKNKCLAKDTCG